MTGTKITAESLLSGEDSISRQELYKKLGDQQFPSMFYGRKVECYTNVRNGGLMIFGSGAGLTIILTIIFFASSHFQAPFHSLREAMPLLVGACPVLGATILLGLTLTVIGVCKKRNHLKEKLDKEKIEDFLNSLNVMAQQEKDMYESVLKRQSYQNSLKALVLLNGNVASTK